MQHVEALGLQPQPIGHASTGHQPADQPSQPQAHTQQVRRLLVVAVAECPLEYDSNYHRPFWRSHCQPWAFWATGKHAAGWALLCGVDHAPHGVSFGQMLQWLHLRLSYRPPVTSLHTTVRKGLHRCWPCVDYVSG